MLRGMKRLKEIVIPLVRLKKNIRSGSLKILLPALYIIVLLMSLLISILYIFIPSLQICPVIFAQKVCAPVGIYIALFASLPGYILVGNILNFLVGVSWGISLAIVILVTVGFYFLVGLFLENYKKRNRAGKTKLLIWTIFGSFLILFLILLFRNQG